MRSAAGPSTRPWLADWATQKRSSGCIESGEEHFDFVEIMACPTGCIGGAGQPESFLEDKKKRSSGLYTADKSALVKRSDENPVVTKLYEDGVLKDRAKELLHVHYKAPAASQ